MFWRVVEVLMGLVCVGMGLFNKEFAPSRLDGYADLGSQRKCSHA